MPETILSDDLTQLPEPVAPSCQVCGRVNDLLVHAGPVPGEITALLPPGVEPAAETTQICTNCVELFSRAKTQIDSHRLIFEQTDHVLPTPLRLDADDRFTGRGVTIAFLDSGFYAHDDLIKPANRIVAYKSIFDAEDDRTSLETTDVASWHGMMTSVVAAGNGFLSGGFYRGIAPEAKVALVKVGRSGHIPDEHIALGLEWVLANKEKHEIRIVNISAGGDFEQSYLDSPLCRLVERATRAGLLVVCAVGNAGGAPGHPVLPPANSPAAIAVGGLDDQNSLDRARRGMYRSSYGPTIDGLQKPEIIAPGIWVAAPILPATPTADEAQLCSELNAAADADLRAIIESHAGVDRDFDEARSLPAPLLRQLITIKLREGNVISQHYKYVDGTSFASPIVASIAACMLEANPALTPMEVKRILIDTAERVPDVAVERQGWGVVAPRKAVEQALVVSSRR
ncbi:MAG: serine protease AprX [Pyrinomonadaceae bacterium]|jgi:serine protease AprX|nr:serine protease AprX [Pyrinomonadaceae bacterium]